MIHIITCQGFLRTTMQGYDHTWTISSKTNNLTMCDSSYEFMYTMVYEHCLTLSQTNPVFLRVF